MVIKVGVCVEGRRRRAIEDGYEADCEAVSEELKRVIRKSR